MGTAWAEARFLLRALYAALKRRSSTVVRGLAVVDCGATEVVPFPVVALSKSLEGRDCGIHPWFVVASADSRFLDSARSSALRMIFLRSE